MSPDHAARRVLMSAFLYYRCAAPVLSDGEYDRLTEVAASGWADLAPIRRWQLESPETIRASGHGCRITTLTADAALAWHLREKRAAVGEWVWPTRAFDPTWRVYWFRAEG